MSKLLSSLVIVLMLLMAPNTWADGVIVNSHNPVAAGRGGTNGAHSDNGGVILDNPAGMTHFESDQYFEADFSLLYNSISYSDPLNPERKGDTHFPENPAVLPTISYVQRISDKLSVGGGIYAPAGLGTHIPQTHPTFGPSTYQSFAAMIKVTPAVAYQVTDKLSVGASVGLGIGHANIRGPFHFQTGFPGVPANLRVKGQDVVPVWHIGVQYELLENTIIGLTYTGQTQFSLEGDGSLFVPAIAFSSRYDADIAIAFPRHVRLAISSEIRPRHRVSVEASWYDWSSAFDDLKITLYNTSNPALGTAPLTDILPLNWRDSISFRFGYEWDINDANTLRFGFATQQAVVPSRTLTSYIPATLKHHITTGYTYRFLSSDDEASEWQLHLAYAYWFGNQSVQTSALAGGDFSGARIKNSYHNFLLGVSFLN